MEEIREEVKVTGGIGTFFYTAIPLVLGFAALAWLAFLTGIVEFRHSQDAYVKQQTYEGRREQRVGVNGEILKPVDLVYTSRGCVKIDRSFLDTQTLTVYVRNTCGTNRKFIHLQAREYSPDGTTLHVDGDWLHAGDDSDLQADEKREVTIDTSDDARTVKIVVSVDSGE